MKYPISVISTLLVLGNLTAQTNLSMNTVNDASPMIVNNNIMWFETVNNGNPRELIKYEVATKTKTQLTHFDSTLIYPQFNGNQVTWTVQENNNFEIFDITTSSRTVIDNWIYWDYQLGDNYVVYNRSNQDTMRVYDIASQTTTKITARQGYPKDIDGDVLLFMGTDWNLYLYNLKTHSLKAVTNSGNNQIGSHAHLSGNTVVWGGINSNKNLWMYNITSGITTPVASTNDVWDIAVSGDYIIYQTYSSNYKLKKYKISTSATTDVTATAGAYSMAVVSDSLLAYTSSSTNGTTLFVKSLISNNELFSFRSTSCNMADINSNSSVSLSSNSVVWINTLNSTPSSSEIFAWSEYGYLNNAPQSPNAGAWFADLDEDGFVDTGNTVYSYNNPLPGKYILNEKKAFNLSYNSKNDNSPWIVGDQIVWFESVNNANPRELVHYDLTNGTKTKLTNFGLTLIYAQFNGAQVSWTVQENNNFEIFDIASKNKTIIDNWTYWDYQLGSNYLVYNRSNQDTMRVYDIASETISKITVKQGYPKDIDGDLLLFRGTDWNLYLYNLKTKTLKSVTTGGNNQIGSDAHISGNFVVYGGINADKNLWLYNISTDITTPVRNSNDVQSIAIDGDFIVYQIYASGYQLLKYRISTGDTSTIAAGSNYGPILISDSLIVYTISNSGSTTLIVRNINNNQELITFKGLPCFVANKNSNGSYSSSNNLVVWTNTVLDALGNPVNGSAEILKINPFATYQADCDDNNPNIHPGAVEIPNNGIDEDCDGADLVNGLNNFNANKNIFTLYPNPNNGYFLFTAALPVKENFEIAIHDIYGKQITGRTVENSEYFQEYFDLTNYPSGVYFVSFISNGHNETLRFIKL